MNIPSVPNCYPGPPCVAPQHAGHAVVTPTGKFEAGSYQTFRLTYTAGPYGIDDSGSIKVAFRYASDQGKPQFADPAAPNYTTVVASNGAVLEYRYDVKQNIRPWDQVVYIKVVKNYLSAGDTITITFGDRSGGSPGMRIQTFVERHFEFRVLVDPIAIYHYVLLPEQPAIEIIPGPPSRWVAVLPTLRRVGEVFTLKLRADDVWGNPSDQVDQVVRLRPSRPVGNLPDCVIFRPGVASRVVDGLTAEQPGDLTIDLLPGGDEINDARSTTTLMLATSNLLRVVPPTGIDAVHFWGDLHGQSGETIGTNSARAFFEFGRDKAFIDVVGHQGNDFQITPQFWTELGALTAKFNESGKYVTLPGYEWSGHTSLGGDRNVFFREEGRPIHRSSHALVADRSDEHTDCLTAVDLFETFRRDGEDVVCFAHIGGRYSNLKFAHDDLIECSVEVHSSWGTFEWILRDAFEMGYRVGIVANSDDHKGRPGASEPGASYFGARGGLTCLIMPELSRAAVFECLRRRRHYATTGSRPFLDVTVLIDHDGRRFADDPTVRQSHSDESRRFRMGDIARITDEQVTLQVNFASKSPIERIEIRNGLELYELVRPYAPDQLGSRIRVIWSGAECRGRMRQTNWDGSAKLEDNRFAEISPINFFNCDKTLRRAGENGVAWQSLTAGNFSGFEARLANPLSGKLSILTRLVECDVPVADIGYHDRVFEAGGLDRRVRLFRLPDDNPHKVLTLERQIPLRRGRDNPLYVCVTTEDGHQAWSSPIYLMLP